MVLFTPMGELVGMILVKFRIFTDIFPIWWTVPYLDGSITIRGI